MSADIRLYRRILTGAAVGIVGVGAGFVGLAGPSNAAPAPAKAGPTAAPVAPPAPEPSASTESMTAGRVQTTVHIPPTPATTAPPARTPTATTGPSVPVTTTGPTTPTAAATSPGTSSATATTTPAGYAGSWGLYAPDFPGTLATVDALQSDAHRTASYIMWYVHWAGPYNQLDLANLATVRTNGSTPLITWMSDDPTGLTNITDSAVAAGRYDSYIRSWAQGLRAYGHPVLLRFDMEMNGDWSGWSPGVNGNTAASFVSAWRHVYGIFSAAGASNVTFVWSPNVDYTGVTPMASVYPGDSYVGMVGLDGYNWGTVDGHVWQTPQQVFGPSVAEIATITKRPLMITEVGSTSVGGDKTGWIGQFFQYLQSSPRVRGFVWFDDDKETDWSIGSVPGSLSAFEAGLDG